MIRDVDPADEGEPDHDNELGNLVKAAELV